MATGRERGFSAVQSVGGLLPVEMLNRIAGGKDVDGSKPVDYGVVGMQSVRDEAERHWDYLKSAWRELRKELPSTRDAEAPADPRGIAVTGWLEPLFGELGFGKLSAVGPAGIASDDGEKHFAISHHWNHVPIHLVAWNTKLDKKSGSSSVPAQSLVQECLNRSKSQLWGILTNGRQLRLLRDSSSFATAAYVEFDLEAIFDGELFSDFVLLFRLLHVSRFTVQEGEPASTCWLEKWRLKAIETGVRALDQYRKGVEDAIVALGTGFLKRPENDEALRTVDNEALRTALLRLVYRLIFLFVIEDRDLLHTPDATSQARERYRRYFSTERLRDQARNRRGTAHTDLYRALTITFDALGDENGRPELGLPGLGGLFDDRPADRPLRGLVMSNQHLLDAVRALARVWDEDTRRWRPVDYRNMDAEELGSVYESLLELVPQRTVDRTFELVNRLGNDRKKTGSFYTPTTLIDPLLDSTLNPVIDDAQRRGLERARATGETDPAEAVVAELLSITVCDPACGSGHFLVAAARRIAKRVAAIRENNPEPTPPTVRHALHEVIGRCVYGVDLNPMAVDLAKVSLWLEAMEPGVALGFLDAHIKHGNGLIGATPATLRNGIPDEAFKPVEGDDPKISKSWETLNRKAHEGQGGLWDLNNGPKVSNTSFASDVRRITRAPAAHLTQVRKQEAAYAAWGTSAEFQHALHIADAWCAAFMWHKTHDAPLTITQDVFLSLQDPHEESAPRATHDEIRRLRDRYRFFHWHLEFPEIFTVPEDASEVDVDPVTGWSGGFSCVLGNPPWERLEWEDKKYFDGVEPSIAALSGTARGRRIADWEKENPEAAVQYQGERRRLKSTSMFAATSGTFPLCAKSLTAGGVTKLQADQLFVERFSSIVDPGGRFGCIVPTAIATSAGGQFLFGDFTRRESLAALYDFENRAKIFPGVDSRQKFCLLSLLGRGLHESAAQFAFFLTDAGNLDDTSKVFPLDSKEIDLLSPNTGTLPIFRSRRDADLAIAIYQRFPVLRDESPGSGNPWHIEFKYLFRNANDGDLLRDRDDLLRDGWELKGNTFERDGKRMLPVYEAKMVDFFNHRAADVVKSATAVNRQNQPRYLNDHDLLDPERSVVSLNWISAEERIPVKRRGKEIKALGLAPRLNDVHWTREWLCGWCDVTASTNERTAIPAFIPRTPAMHTFPLMFSHVAPNLVAALIAVQSSLVFDFVSRQKISDAHMKLFIWKQLPVPTPAMLKPHTAFITPRVLELVYTAYDMEGLARDLDDNAPPFRWDEHRRTKIRAELDAYFFHLYGIDRVDAEYILETFQSDSGGGLKNNEIAKYGTYRTKELVLEAFDRMAYAGVDLDHPLHDGENFCSLLDPPPGHGRRHALRVPVAQDMGN
ncbi:MULTISPECIES: Eco57I restriction-modification methylase domain-containing protein [unclassified Nocardia]|uniref:Eco57I restriction-modification methylase domain-containing protein n=1 Tax=unclassified Nocardia TaxID=2637762 RepID=UPI00278C2DF4|nr:MULTISPECIES: DNA methyltransferase [unclassified Nocardia]